MQSTDELRKQLSFKLPHDPHTADDICQDVYLAMRDKAPDNPDAYALGAANKRILKVYRQQKQRRTVELSRLGPNFDAPIENDPLHQVSQADLIDWLGRKIELLPPKLREVIKLYRQNPSFRWIADSLGVPIGTAKNRYALAIKRLQNRAA
jgi:RNA polymerase sigma factor (sigma-70 family)